MNETTDEDTRLPNLDETLANPARGTTHILATCARLARLLQRSRREAPDGVCLWHRFSAEEYGALGCCEVDIRYAAEATAGTVKELLEALRGLTHAIRRAIAAGATTPYAMPDEYNEALAAIAKATREGE